MIERLKPCLVCGSIDIEYTGYYWHYFTCRNCSASTLNGQYRNKQDAIFAWNNMEKPEVIKNISTNKKVKVKCSDCGKEETNLTHIAITEKYNDCAFVCYNCDHGWSGDYRTNEELKSFGIVI